MDVAETGDQFLLEDGLDHSTGIRLSGKQWGRVIRARRTTAYSYRVTLNGIFDGASIQLPPFGGPTLRGCPYVTSRLLCSEIGIWRMLRRRPVKAGSQSECRAFPNSSHVLDLEVGLGSATRIKNTQDQIDGRLRIFCTTLRTFISMGNYLLNQSSSSSPA